MNTVVRLVLFVFFIFVLLLVGRKVYIYFNEKMMSSNGWMFLAYTFVLVMAFAILFFGSLLCFVYLYDYLMVSE